MKNFFKTKDEWDSAHSHIWVYGATAEQVIAFCGAQRPQMRFRAAALRSKTATRLMQVISC